MDLGHDNQMVAAKSWAALFAAADWARRVEQGKKQAPPETPEASWAEVFRLLRDNAEAKAKIEAWRAFHHEFGGRKGSWIFRIQKTQVDLAFVLKGSLR